jgi:hypothetical protein
VSANLSTIADRGVKKKQNTLRRWMWIQLL